MRSRSVMARDSTRTNVTSYRDLALAFSFTTMSNDDDNPRPTKRPRTDPSLSQVSSSSTLTPPPSSPPAATEASGESSSTQHPALKPLPEPVLLVALPRLLIHPPNHRYYIKSLFLSLCSLRRCLALPALSPEIECQAWTGLAEIGMKVIHGGLSQNEAHTWASGIEVEVCVCPIASLVRSLTRICRSMKRSVKG